MTLTADTTKSALDRIARERVASLPDLLTQVPHHGARPNHSGAFWPRTSTERLAAVSVGPSRDDHPSAVVLDQLRDRGYRVLSTWLPGSAPGRRNATSRSLDVAGRRVRPADRTGGGDVGVRFDRDGVVEARAPYDLPGAVGGAGA